MHMTHITLLETAKILGKSLQTVRRLVKSKRLQSIKEDTPQGFIYRVNADELKNLLNELSTDQPTIQSTIQPPIQNSTLDRRNSEQEKVYRRRKSRHNAQKGDFGNRKKNIRHRTREWNLSEFFEKEIGKLNAVIERLVEQTKNDKENFFGIIKTFQDRVIVLENHIKFLEAPKKKWWRFWMKKL